MYMLHRSLWVQTRTRHCRHCVRPVSYTHLEPISHLIRKYSIPTALTLMVNYLYNIADQIFVGQGVGITGMAATNVAFPLTIVTTALALMLGEYNQIVGTKDYDSSFCRGLVFCTQFKNTFALSILTYPHERMMIFMSKRPSRHMVQLSLIHI